MTAKTTVRLRGTYLWPIDATPPEPIPWSGVDLSGVLDAPLPGFCAYYGRRSGDALAADMQLIYPSGRAGRLRGEYPNRAVDVLEIDVMLTNPAPGREHMFDRWAQADTPVLDLREERFPLALLPVLAPRFDIQQREELVAVLSTAPVRARALLLALPHLEAVVLPLVCRDAVRRDVMWVVDPMRAVKRITPRLSHRRFDVQEHTNE